MRVDSKACRFVAALRPKPAAEPMIRRKPAARSLESRERPSDEERPFSGGESESPKLVGNIEVASPGVHNFRFSAGKEFKEKFERLAEVLGIEGAVRRMPEILEKALDLALEKKDPKKKLERRKKREVTRSKTPLDEARAKTPLDEAGVAKRRQRRERSRYTPRSVRERRMDDASYQCEYTGPDGVRCTARVGLEIDHIIPHAKGGSSGEENLRVLCRGHNLLLAEREFGEEFMRGKIEGRKSEQRGVA